VVVGVLLVAVARPVMATSGDVAPPITRLAVAVVVMVLVALARPVMAVVLLPATRVALAVVLVEIARVTFAVVLGIARVAFAVLLEAHGKMRLTSRPAVMVVLGNRR
jgi:hypothetical protein